MSNLGQVIRKFEDFVLLENDLYCAGRIPFEHQGVTKHGYPYIRSSHQLFERAAIGCAEVIPKPVSEIRFLEVGCGLGTKCEIARLRGMVAVGLDIKPEYVMLARRIFPECMFIEANALDFDYRQFDLVYYHVPFFDDALLFQLECRILSHLPLGGLLCVTDFSGHLLRTVYGADGMKPIFREILRKPDRDLGELHALQKLAACDWNPT